MTGLSSMQLLTELYKSIKQVIQTGNNKYYFFIIFYLEKLYSVLISNKHYTI